MLRFLKSPSRKESFMSLEWYILDFAVESETWKDGMVRYTWTSKMCYKISLILGAENDACDFIMLQADDNLTQMTLGSSFNC